MASRYRKIDMDTPISPFNSTSKDGALVIRIGLSGTLTANVDAQDSTTEAKLKRIWDSLRPVMIAKIKAAQ